MATRTALRQSPWLTFAVLLAAGWIVLSALAVVDTMNWVAGFVGHAATAGLVGLAVLAVVLGLAVVLYGELGGTDPAPEPWPPE